MRVIIAQSKNRDPGLVNRARSRSSRGASRKCFFFVAAQPPRLPHRIMHNAHGRGGTILTPLLLLALTLLALATYVFWIEPLAVLPLLALKGTTDPGAAT